jgi:hypothetical protein
MGSGKLLNRKINAVSDEPDAAFLKLAHMLLATTYIIGRA